MLKGKWSVSRFANNGEFGEWKRHLFAGDVDVQPLGCAVLMCKRIGFLSCQKMKERQNKIARESVQRETRLRWRMVHRLSTYK